MLFIFKRFGIHWTQNLWMGSKSRKQSYHCNFFQQCLGNTSCKKMFSFGHCPNYLSLFYRRCSLLLCFWPKDIQKKTNQTLCPISIFRENSSDVTCRQALFLLIPNMGFQWSLSHLHIQPSSLWSFNLFPPIQTFTYNSVILLITKVTSSVRCYTSSQRPSTHLFTKISSAQRTHIGLSSIRCASGCMSWSYILPNVSHQLALVVKVAADVGWGPTTHLEEKRINAAQTINSSLHYVLPCHIPLCNYMYFVRGNAINLQPTWIG